MTTDKNRIKGIIMDAAFTGHGIAELLQGEIDWSLGRQQLPPEEEWGLYVSNEYGLEAATPFFRFMRPLQVMAIGLPRTHAEALEIVEKRWRYRTYPPKRTRKSKG